MSSVLKVAAFQMATTDDVAENARKLHGAIDEAVQPPVGRAAESGAHVLIVPECALSGYLPRADLDLGAVARAQDELSSHAAERGLWLALGTTTRREGRLFNTALMYSPSGELAASYDKTHLTPQDEPVFAGGADLSVFKIGEWTAALQICFDMRFPENWRILRRQGAELVLHMSSASTGMGWKVPVLNGTMRCRAAENGMFVVTVNDARAPQMMVSAICDPDGLHLARAAFNREMLITAELDRTKVKDDFLAARRTDLWDRPQHRKLLLE